MDKQKRIFEWLSFGPFLANLVTILFSPRKEKGDVFYASANYKVQEPNNTRPDDHRDYFEHDVIMVLAHCGERAYEEKTRRQIVNKYVVSIEIKTSLGDIWKSPIDKYLGATRLFFIAAPRRLLRPVIDKYRGPPAKRSSASSTQTPARWSSFRRSRTSRKTGMIDCLPVVIRANIASPSAAGMSSLMGFIELWRPTLPPQRGWTATAFA